MAIRAPALCVFRSVLADDAGDAWRALLDRSAAGETAQAADAYARLFAAVAPAGWAGDAWRCHLAQRVLRDGNAYTLAVAPGPGLRAAAADDLHLLEGLAADATLESLRAPLAAAGYRLPPLAALGTRQPEGLTAQLVAGRDWPALLEALRAAARRGAAGPYAAPSAWRWHSDPGGTGGGRLQGVAHADAVPPEEFFGYATERRTVAENTERFLRGLPANDVLLYGDRGTGKSSTVKALLPRYAPEGLRLVELAARHLADLPLIYATLDGQPQRFVVFVDDLSFVDDGPAYREAKSALQGGLQRKPDNVLVYATSNRRHLIAERFTDRPDPAAADPRAGDAVQEKLSLADRFGLTVVFSAPDQELFLHIVSHLARARGLDIPAPELRQHALRWALWQGGRSGRTADQCIRALEGLRAGRDADNGGA